MSPDPLILNQVAMALEAKFEELAIVGGAFDAT
jgi:hypothetical protein